MPPLLRHAVPHAVPQVQSRYRDVPYHNFAHCTDVTHATFMFVR